MWSDRGTAVAGAKPDTAITASVESIYRFLLATSVALLMLSLIGQLAVHWAPDFLGRDWYALQFDVDREQSIPTLFAILLHLGASVSAALVSWSLRQTMQAHALPWLLVSGLFVLTMIDEQVGNHERLIEPLRARFDAGGGFHYAWFIAGLPLAALLALCFLRPVLSLPRNIRLTTMTAAGLFLAGALGAEMLGGAYVAAGNRLHSAGMEAFLHLEEGLEMIGVSTFIYAMLRFRVEYFGACQVQLSR